MVRFLFCSLFCAIATLSFANNTVNCDSLFNGHIIDLDATLDSLITKPATIQSTIEEKAKLDSIIAEEPIRVIDARTLRQEIDMIIRNVPLIKIDTLISENNFLFLPLVLRKQPFPFNYKKNLLKYTLFIDQQPVTLKGYKMRLPEIDSDLDYLQNLRLNALQYIVITNPHLVAYLESELPSIEDVKSGKIDINYYEKSRIIDDTKMSVKSHRKLVVEKAILSPWTHSANAYIQFSQNYVSKNWHQGGSDNLAILGTVKGKLNYDDKNNIQWENSAEWRAGFNSIEGDTTRLLNTNDDIFRVNSKLGIKAGGAFFYSGSFDFSTPVFPTYKAVNSTTLKAAFMTPVRLNISAGIDYKYKKLFSIMVSPFSYKYIFLNNPKVDPKLFGIKAGEDVLSEMGSSFRIQGNYAPSKEITFDSKLSFYTNYTKVEIDWEIIGNFQVNRFLSTRLILNPRYDNTVIMAAGYKAKIQFKELLTFGLSYKLLN
ncbi:MAG: DUF3078 domain-containing protein [Paludibacter sp.]